MKIVEKEKDLHKQLVVLLNIYKKTNDFMFFHIKNDVGARKNNFFYDLNKLGVLFGIPDFCFIQKNKVFFLEIKTTKGKLSGKQKDVINQLQIFNIPCYVAFGWEEIKKNVKKILNIT